MRAIGLAFILGFSTLCFGADKTESSGSEFQHQASAGRVDFAGALAYGLVTVKTASTNLLTKEEVRQFAGGILGEYGISEMISMGVNLQYSWNWNEFSPSDLTSNTHSVGWSDPNFFLKGRLDGIVPGSIRLGLSVSVSPADKTDSNFYSGGTAIDPLIGYEIEVGRQIIGAHSDYKVFVGSQNFSPSSDLKYQLNGGETWTSSVFYENVRESYSLGLSGTATVVASSSSTAVSDAAINTNLANGKGRITNGSSSATLYSIAAYAPIDVSPTMRVVPRATYSTAGAFNNASLSSNDGWGLQLLARAMF